MSHEANSIDHIITRIIFNVGFPNATYCFPFHIMNLYYIYYMVALSKPHYKYKSHHIIDKGYKSWWHILKAKNPICEITNKVECLKYHKGMHLGGWSSSSWCLQFLFRYFMQHMSLRVTYFMKRLVSWSD
jgi:hypothetical protein